MKKLLVVVTLLASASVFAASDDLVFEPTVGPSIGIHNAGHNFLLEPRIGWEMIKFGLGMYLGNSVAFRPHIAVDIPFYLSLAESDDFGIGPTFDAGPSFNVKGTKFIDFMQIGFGLKTTYRFMDNFGVVFVPVHMGMSFAGWTSGAGAGAGFAMVYDLKFGVFLEF